MIFLYHLFTASSFSYTATVSNDSEEISHVKGGNILAWLGR